MRWLILITYLIQFLEIVRFPVPSEFSTLRLVQTGQQPHWRHFGLGLLGILTFHLPLVFIIYPGVTIKMNALISPIFNPLPVSVVAPLLLAGSVLTMLGVRALRSRERMENPAAGNLTTTGIYRVCRHPINLGLMLIMTGFFGGLSILDNGPGNGGLFLQSAHPVPLGRATINVIAWNGLYRLSAAGRHVRFAFKTKIIAVGGKVTQLAGGQLIAAHRNPLRNAIQAS